MGILNVTPDSFYNGGLYLLQEKALKKAKEMIKDGADIIDIGGESTRPGADPVPLEVELERIIPVIEEISDKFDITISVDTYKAEVAKKALEAGAKMVNDISGLRFDPKMVDTVASAEVPVVVMHMKGVPKTMQQNPYYEDVVSEIKAFFEERLDFLTSQGVKEEHIILDPGIGFGKRLMDNLRIINAIDSFLEFGRPILIGASRKSLIGEVLNLPSNERLEGTLSIVAITTYLGANIHRVHDVKEAKRAAQMAWAIRRANE